MFGNRKGDPLRESKLLRNVLQPAAEAAGLGRVTWHQFRHIHSSLLNDLRVPVKIAQEQLGHASISTTLNIYTHVVDASHRKAVEAVEDPRIGQSTGLAPLTALPSRRGWRTRVEGHRHAGRKEERGAVDVLLRYRPAHDPEDREVGRQRESRAAAHVDSQSRQAQRGAELVVLERYDWLIEPVNHAESESAISSAPLPNTAPREK